MKLATPQEPSPEPKQATISVEEWFETYFKRHTNTAQFVFGDLTLSENGAGVIGNCCGNIHLDRGQFRSVESEILPFEEATKDFAEQFKKKWGAAMGHAGLFSDQVGIYSGQYMSAEELKKTVGLAPDSPCLELVDDDGSVHSFAWKDA